MTARKVAGKAASGALVGCADMSPAQERFAQACFDAALRVVACQLQARH